MIKKDINNKQIAIITAVGVVIVLIVVIAVAVNRSGTVPGDVPEREEGFMATDTRRPVPDGIRVPEAGEEVRDKEVAVPTVTTSAAPGVSAKLRAFSIKADAGKFDPSNIIVNKGDTINIVVEAIDNNYDFVMPDFGLKQVMEKGQKKVVEFQATNEGQFVYYCESCGGLGSKARGTITIVPRQM